jgi:hypothetical protein
VYGLGKAKCRLALVPVSSMTTSNSLVLVRVPYEGSHWYGVRKTDLDSQIKLQHLNFGVNHVEDDLALDWIARLALMHGWPIHVLQHSIQTEVCGGV